MTAPIKNAAAVALGKLGGKAGVKNPAKARTSEQARAAVNARWAKRRAEITVKSAHTGT